MKLHPTSRVQSRLCYRNTARCLLVCGRAQSRNAVPTSLQGQHFMILSSTSPDECCSGGKAVTSQTRDTGSCRPRVQISHTRFRGAVITSHARWQQVVCFSSAPRRTDPSAAETAKTPPCRCEVLERFTWRLVLASQYYCCALWSHLIIAVDGRGVLLIEPCYSSRRCRMLIPSGVCPDTTTLTCHRASDAVLHSLDSVIQ